MKARFLLVLGFAFALSATIPGSATPRAPSLDPMPATAGDVGRVLGDLGATDHAAEGRLAAAARESAQLDALLSVKGRAYVKLTRAGLLPVSGGLSALLDHASRIERLRRALQRALDRQRVLAELRVKLSADRAALDEQRSALSAEQASLTRSRSAILAAEEREMAFRRAFLGNQDGHTAVYASGFGPAQASDSAGGFAGMKGRLPLPIEGRVEVRPGKLPGVDGPGLEMATSPGAEVRSIYPGRVAFADTYGGYGLTAILDHGGGFFSISANLGRLSVRVGDELGSGGAIGTAGTSPRGSGLYLELRKGTETLDPGTWFGL